jgi:hypothetical protein
MVASFGSFLDLDSDRANHHVTPVNLQLAFGFHSFIVFDPQTREQLAMATFYPRPGMPDAGLTSDTADSDRE